jgi:hypothetical protein
VARTNYFLHWTDAHGLGPANSRSAKCLGMAEMMVVQDTSLAAAVPIAVGDVVEPAVDETVDASTTFFRAIVTSVGVQAGIGTYFTARIVPTSAWFTTASIALLSIAQIMQDMRSAWTQDALLANFAVSGATSVGAGSMLLRTRAGSTTEIQVKRLTFWDDAYNYKSRDRALHEVTGSTAEPAYYDKHAQRARRFEVSGGGNIVPGDIVGDAASPNWTAVCVASNGTASPNHIFLAAITGTPAVSDSLWVQDGSGTFADSGRDITLIGAAESVGIWTPYSPTPGIEQDLEKLTAGTSDYGVFAIPPRGSWAGKTSTLGIETVTVPRALDLVQGEVDPDNRNARYVSYSTTEVGTTGTNVRGGIIAQELDVTNVVGTPVAGETVSQAVSGWSAKVVMLSGSVLVLHATSGTLDTGEALAFATSGTTADVSGTDGVLGWRRGSKHYEDAVARYQEAVAADGGLSGGAAAAVQKIIVSAWEGDFRAVQLLAGDFATSLAYLLSPTEYAGETVQYGVLATEIAAFINDLINDSRLPVDNLTEVTVWSHKSGPDGYRPTVTDPIYCIRIGDILVSVRDAWNRRAGPAASHTRSDQLGLAYDIDGETAPDTFLDVASALQSGRDVWTSLIAAKVVPADSSWEYLYIIVKAGQSQQRGFAGSSLIDVDKDVGLYMTSQFPPAPYVDTTRDSVMQWSEPNQRIERYDLAAGSNGAFFVSAGQFGDDCSQMARARERFPKVLLFKVALSGSCIDRDITGASGCWDPTLIERQHLAFTNLTFSDDGATWSVETATANGFAALFGAVDGLIDDEQTHNAVYFRSSNGAYNDAPFVSHFCDGTASTSTRLVFNGPLPFAAGSPAESVTIYAGPPPIWPHVEDEWARCIDSIVNLGDGDQAGAATKRYIPLVAVLDWEQWESDAAKADDYLDNLRALFDKIDAVFAPEGLRGNRQPATIVTLAHQGSPVGTDEQLAAVRAAQQALVAERPNTRAVEPSMLALEHDKASLPPYVSVRQENGVHFTRRATVTKGFLKDAAIDGMDGIPDHPTGTAAVEYGAAISGTFTSDEGAGAGDGGAGEEGGGEDDPPAESGGEDGPPATPEQQQALTDAMHDAPDVAAYTTPDGASVTRRSVDDMIKLEQHQEAKAARRRLGRTVVDFRGRRR